MEDILRRAAGVLDEAVSLATAGGPVVVHGEIEPRNIIVGTGGEYTLVDWGDLGLGWAALDLAPCLGFDQISLYREKAKDRNPYWKPPGERALAAARLVHSLINLKRLVRDFSDGSSQPPEVIEMWVERIVEALNRL
ncbi:phosphotransferase [bacterium]|nr:phosphotransferase [bacterium]